MGYRSDVRMVIRGHKNVILREYATLRLTGSGEMQAALGEWALHALNGEAAVAILGKGGVDWKWYESYPGVQAHTAIFAHFQELQADADPTSQEYRLDGAFVRIGEDADDTETEYFGDGSYDLAYPTRSITCEYDHLGDGDLRLVKSAA